jgi:hypothetical protein
MLDQSSHVICHQLNAQRAVDVGRAPMALQVSGDHLPRLGERRQVRAKHFRRTHAAMKQNQRWILVVSFAVNLVIHFETVHGSVVTLRGWGLDECHCQVKPDWHHPAKREDKDLAEHDDSPLF